MKRLINHIVVIFSICSETRHRHVIRKISTSQNRRQMFPMMLPSFNELTCQIHQNTENSCIHTRFPVYNHNTREASLHVSNFVKKISIFGNDDFLRCSLRLCDNLDKIT